MPGIKETKEALEFALTLGKAVDESQENGFQWTDVFSLVPPMTLAPAAISGANEIPAEIEDLDDSEKQELYSVVDSLDLKSDMSEKLVKQALKAATEVSVLALLIRDARKQ